MKTSLAIACVLAAAGTFVTAASRSDSPDPPRVESPVAMVDRFLQSGAPELQTYQARRRLEASTMGGRMKATVEAWTSVDSAGVFRYEIISEAGSDLIRKHVLIGALKAEQKSRDEKEAGQAELTPANYDFEVDEQVSEGLVTIRLLPRRQSPMLLNGSALVNQSDGDLVKVRGRLSKRPSWWTKQVDIERKYSRIAGVRVPVEMSSRADVRIAGDATFSMAYEYRMINGRTIE
jgi:hypothetical protein